MTQLSAHANGRYRHGLSKTPIYKVWSDMIRRCTSPKATDYEIYGGRGIRVCERWLNGDGVSSGLELFAADMGPRPKYRCVVINRHTFSARLLVNGKKVSGGRYPTQLQAAIAIDDLAFSYFGTDWRFNFPERIRLRIAAATA